METVNDFKSEMNSLYETRLPVSRAKISQITKLAMKAAKYYKHVVMIVEKFISKCGPAHKLAGLYVIDSIVRQSQHQFGGEKDVYTLRFAKNFSKTFSHLFQCILSDQGKIVRVLNLWQKNAVYRPDIIQPLLVMASDGGGGGGVTEDDMAVEPDLNNGAASRLLLQQQKLLEQQQQQLNSLLQAGGVPASELTVLLQKAEQLKQLQSLQQQLMKATHLAPPPPSSSSIPANGPGTVEQARAMTHGSEFNEALLDHDFDYSSEEEDGEHKPRSLLLPSNSEPPVMEVSATELIDQMQEQFQREQHWKRDTHSDPPPELLADMMLHPHHASFDQQRLSLPPPPPPPPPPHMLPPFTSRSRSPRPDWHSRSLPPPPPPPPSLYRSPPRHISSPPPHSRWDHWPPRGPPPLGRYRDHSPPPPPPPPPRFRDRSPQRPDKHNRRKRNQPGPKSQSMTVCSTTIWLGHLAKSITTDIIKDTCEKYGEVKSVDLVAARGCAYVVMRQRADANRAMEKLREVKLGGSYCKVAWAPGRGVKGAAFQNFWDLDHGVSFIPWEKLQSTSHVEAISEGGWVDPATLPPSFKSSALTSSSLVTDPEAENTQPDDMLLSTTPP